LQETSAVLVVATLVVPPAIPAATSPVLVATVAGK